MRKKCAQLVQDYGNQLWTFLTQLGKVFSEQLYMWVNQRLYTKLYSLRTQVYTQAKQPLAICYVMVIPSLHNYLLLRRLRNLF